MSRSSVPIPSFIAFGLHLCVDSHQQRLAAPCLHLCHDIHLASRPRRDVGSSDLELRYTAARMCATLGEQPPKITNELAKFSAEFDRVIGITKS